MATSNDNINLKINVQGQSSLDSLNTSLGNISKTSEQTANVLRSFNTRTLSANIQDIAVQAELGVSWMRILGQQGSEVLAAFGPRGAAAGAALAVGIGIARPVLKELGFDLRSTKEAITDLEKSTQLFTNAQRANQSSASFLTSEYGLLSSQAKEFFQVQQELVKSKSLSDLTASVGKIKDDFKAAGLEASTFNKSIYSKIPIVGEIAALPGLIDQARGAWARFGTGLTAENAQRVSELMKDIDANNPKETANTLNEVLKYLKSIDGAGSDVVKNFSNTIEPIIKANQALLEQERNIKAAAERARDLNIALFGDETAANKQINAAKRNFDQITAIRKEAALKSSTFEKQSAAKTAEDGVDRAAEVAAFKAKTDQEASDRIKDFTKGQYETFRTALMTNEAKKRQLGLESDILKLQESGKLAALNVVQFEQDLLTNANNYKEALVAIDEQRRKNNITVEQQKKLETEAADIKAKADDIAYQSMWKRQQDFIATQQQLIKQDERRFKVFKDTLTMSDAQKKNAEAIAAIDDERYKQLKGIESLSDPILRIVQEKEINAIYDERIQKLKDQQKAELELSRSFDVGWAKAFNNYVDNATNAARQAETIFNKFTSSMEDMLVNLFKTGKLGWRDFLQTMIDQLMRSQVQQLLAKTFGSIGTIGGKSSSGGLFGGALIPGFLAEGGPANANQPYIVGERGPELFVPNSTGTVVPNDALGGGTSVVYNINAVDAMSFKQMLAADPTFLHAVAEQGRRRMPGAR